MILLFHFFFYIIKHLAQQRKTEPLEELNLSANEEVEICKTDYAKQNFLFDPPVYRQRYAAVEQILRSNSWRKSIKKVVDFGCAECGLFQFIKRLYRIQEILEVDIDEDVLNENLFRLHPIISDYINRRTEPLTVEVVLGSISDPDAKLLNTDAVIGIEIIEHLFPDTLEALPYNIFGFIKPKIAIFSTPNADFNILFSNFEAFRHHDHKFEWSREQFESWALNISKRFPEYSVSFQGVGEGPKGTDNLGYCSQIALFVRDCNISLSRYSEDLENTQNNSTTSNKCIRTSWGICTYLSHSRTPYIPNCKKDPSTFYKLIESIEYPYDIDNRTPEQKILDELKYKINSMSHINGRYYNEEEDRFEIPLIQLIYNQYTHFTTVNEAREILETAGFQVKQCIVCNDLETCVIFKQEMESHSSSPTSNRSENDCDEECSELAITENEIADWERDSVTQRNDELLLQDSISVQQTEAAINASEVLNSLVNNIQPISNWLQQKSVPKTEQIIKFQNIVKIKDKPHALNADKKVQLKEDMPGTSNMKKKKKIKKTEVDDETFDPNHIEIHENEEDNEADAIVLNQVNEVEVEDVPQIPEILVENGDLVNNNRDLEGNNYPDAIEILLENIEENLDEHHNQNNNHNVGVVLQNNVQIVEEVRNVDDENQNVNVENINHVEDNPVNDEEVNQINELDVAIASREALFDPNSLPDLLEEFNVSPTNSQSNVASNNDPMHNVILIGVHVNNEEEELGPLLPNNADPFPNWLLQLLGNDVIEEVDEHHDEPHFYCQGDGIGVHPSFVEVEFEEHSSSDSNSSGNESNVSNDDTGGESSVSERDANSLPEVEEQASSNQNPHGNVSNSGIISRPSGVEALDNSNVSNTTASSDEFFDSMEESLSVNISENDQNSRESQ